MRSDVAKLIVAVALDVVDFTIGRIPGLELPVDIVLGVVAVMLWGWTGLFAFWETIDPTGQIDGFTPTLTLIAISQLGKTARGPRAGEPLPKSPKKSPKK